MKQATEYIYIEDQYGSLYEPLQAALVKFLEKTSTARLILLIPLNPGLNFGGWDWQRMWMPLKINYVERVIILHPKDAGIKVHSKMMIMDDIYAIIGSANIGSRAFSTDPEIGVAVVGESMARPSDDKMVAKFAHDARVKSWAEHANIIMPLDEWERMSVVDAIESFSLPDSKVEVAKALDFTIEERAHDVAGLVFEWVKQPSTSCAAPAPLSSSPSLNGAVWIAVKVTQAVLLSIIRLIKKVLNAVVSGMLALPRYLVQVISKTAVGAAARRLSTFGSGTHIDLAVAVPDGVDSKTLGVLKDRLETSLVLADLKGVIESISGSGTVTIESMAI